VRLTAKSLFTSRKSFSRVLSYLLSKVHRRYLAVQTFVLPVCRFPCFPRVEESGGNFVPKLSRVAISDVALGVGQGSVEDDTEGGGRKGGDEARHGDTSISSWRRVVVLEWQVVLDVVVSAFSLFCG